MMADLSTALSNPLDLVQSIHDRNPSLDQVEDRISAAFAELLNNPEVLSQIAPWSNSSKAGTVVRFRAMVQDTGMGSEVYRALSVDGKALLMYGRETAEQPEHEIDSYANLKERDTVFLVGVPAQTEWASKVSGTTSSQSSCPS